MTSFYWKLSNYKVALGEKAKWELHKDAARSFEQIIEGASSLQKHKTKQNKTK